MATTQIVDNLLEGTKADEHYALNTKEGAGTFTFIPKATPSVEETRPTLDDFKKAIFGVGYYFYIKDGDEYSKIQRVGGYWNPSDNGSQMNVVLPKTESELYVKFDVIYNPGYYDLHPSTDKTKFSLQVDWTPLITIS